MTSKEYKQLEAKDKEECERASLNVKSINISVLNDEQKNKLIVCHRKQLL